MLDQLAEGFALALRVDTILLMSAGLFAGMVVGALPGFTTLMAMAILLPISFFLDPVVGIPFLLGVYKGGIFGGSVPAILISMPGTGAAVATSLDGYQLTKKGQSRKALDIALFSSVFGDLSSDIFTILMIFPIALLVMQFGPPELFCRSAPEPGGHRCDLGIRSDEEPDDDGVRSVSVLHRDRTRWAVSSGLRSVCSI